MIIWSGLGFLVVVFVFGSCLLWNFALDAQFGEGYYSSHPWAIGAALMVGGVISAIFGFFLKSRNDRDVVDVQTGEPLVINQSQHSLFFVPMHWAGVLIATIGFGIAVFDLVKRLF